MAPKASGITRPPTIAPVPKEGPCRWQSPCQRKVPFRRQSPCRRRPLSSNGHHRAKGGQQAPCPSAPCPSKGAGVFFRSAALGVARGALFILPVSVFSVPEEGREDRSTGQWRQRGRHRSLSSRRWLEFPYGWSAREWHLRKEPDGRGQEVGES